MEFDERRREWVCFDCEEVEAVDRALGHPNVAPDVTDYDEESRP